MLSLIQRLRRPELLADHLPARVILPVSRVTDRAAPAEVAGKVLQPARRVVAIAHCPPRRIGFRSYPARQVISPREIVRLPRRRIARPVKADEALPFAGRSSERVIPGSHIGVPVGSPVAVPPRIVAGSPIHIYIDS